MRILWFTLAVLTFLAHASGAVAQTSLPTTRSNGLHKSLEKGELDSAIRAELYQAEAIRLFTSQEESNQDTAVRESIQGILEKMHSLALEESDPVLSMTIARTTMKTLQAMGRDDDAEKFSSNFFERKDLSCTDLPECLAIAFELGDFVQVLPDKISEISDRIFSGLREYEISSKLIVYKQSALKAFANFYSKTKMRDRKDQGLPPRLIASQISKMKADIEQIDSAYLQLSCRDCIAQTRRALTSELKRQKAAHGQQSAGEPDLDQLATELVNGATATHLGLLALKAYLNRCDQTDIGAFIQEHISLAMYDEEALSVSLIMGTTFADVESYLPWRRDWLNMVNVLALKASQSLGLPVSDLSSSIETLVNLRETTLREALVQQGFDKNRVSPFSGETLDQRLLSGEKYLARTSKSFHSLFFQIHLLQKSQDMLAELAIGFREKQNKAASPQEDENSALEQDSIRGNYFLTAADWLTLACYAKSVPGLSLLQKGMKANIGYSIFAQVPFLIEGEFNLTFACPSFEARLDDSEISRETIQAGPSAEVATYLRQKMEHQTFIPFYVEQGLQLASMPLMWASGGLSMAGAKVATPAVTRLLMSAVFKATLHRMALRGFYRTARKATAAVSGNVAFAMSMRTGLYALTLGQAPLYEPKKTLFENYSKELLLGSAIFFFMPALHSASYSIIHRAVGSMPALNLSPVSRLLLHTGTPFATDVALFTSLPFAERAIQRIAGDQNEPILRGWTDFGTHLGHSVAMTLMFRMSEIHNSYELSRILKTQI